MSSLCASSTVTMASGATQPAADGSSPWIGGGSGLTAADCDPNDVPPGP